MAQFKQVQKVIHLLPLSTANIVFDFFFLLADEG